MASMMDDPIKLEIHLAVEMVSLTKKDALMDGCWACWTLKDSQMSQHLAKKMAWMMADSIQMVIHLAAMLASVRQKDALSDHCLAFQTTKA